MGIKMASKNISIQEKTYKKLLAMKTNEESFTDIIEKLIERTKTSIEGIKPFFGAFKEEPFMSLEELEQNRDEINRDLKKRLK